MIRGIILSAATLIFIILLTIVYLSQKKTNTLSSKLYKATIISIYYMAITSMIAGVCVYYLYSPNGDNTLLDIIYHLHWFSALLFGELYFIYNMKFLLDKKEEKLKDLILNSKLLFSVFIVGIVIFIISLFLPFSYVEYGYKFLPFTYHPEGYYSFIPGPSAILLLSFVSITLLATPPIYAFNHKVTKTKTKRLILLINGSFTALSFLVQMLVQDVDMFPLIACSVIIFEYFLLENPDLYRASELERLKNEIEHSNRAKSDFLSNMSHEIRTPMNSIVGLSSGLLNDEFNPTNARLDIQHIYAAGNNLLDIIDNILDISKIESGTEELDEKEYSLGNVLNELSTIINIRIGSKSIKYVTDIADNIPNKLFGDQTKVTQVLTNILNNSVKYTDVGKIKLTITCDNNRDYANLHIKIADTGYGIKPEDYEKMFTKFNRLDSATSKEIEGTGLGLVITKQYVELMGGKIWFESEYQAGTVFYIDLPQKIIDSNPLNLDIKEENKEEISFSDFSGRRVLIVDDNKLNLVVASRLLEPYKIDVVTVTSGKECIADIKKGSKYDLILLDHMMPEMDGIEVLHVLRKLGDSYEIPPIVVLTANAISGMREMYLKEGFNEYISKPIDVKRLDEILRRFIKPVFDEKKYMEEEEIVSTKDEKTLGVLERLRMRE